MIDLRSRLLAAVLGEQLEVDAGNPPSGCDGVTSLNPLKNTGVAYGPAVTPEFSRKTSEVTPSHLTSITRDGEEEETFAKPKGLRQPYSRCLASLRQQCPAFVEEHRWQETVADSIAFLTQWGAQAAALGWTARDLFGLANIPDRPGPNYRRLSRYDQTGLVWLLRGRRVVALTENKAVIETATGAVSYTRRNKVVPDCRTARARTRILDPISAMPRESSSDPRSPLHSSATSGATILFFN